MFADGLEFGVCVWTGSWRWWMGWKFAVMDGLEVGDDGWAGSWC